MGVLVGRTPEPRSGQMQQHHVLVLRVMDWVMVHLVAVTAFNVQLQVLGLMNGSLPPIRKTRGERWGVREEPLGGMVPKHHPQHSHICGARSEGSSLFVCLRAKRLAHPIQWYHAKHEEVSATTEVSSVNRKE